ncbi:MFS transporter [Aneurinibacillus migulanus]|uniref:MFS transporter n=1 Tax=Aneurinibacillus migulanus TaxID=47500 RepID=UPI002E1C7BF8|nr:MFS transporter [Aneurinibacillus migulanus]
MQKPQGRVLFALSLVPLIMVLGNSMIIPVLPTIAHEYNLSAFQSGLLITLFSIPAGIIIPLAGFLSDRIGRKKIILPALLMYGAGGLVAGGAALFSAQPYVWIVVGRVIQGIGAAGTAPIAMALIGDLYPPEHRGHALGVIESTNALGKVLSPILGSLLALIAWYTLFFVFPLFIIPAIWMIMRWVEEKETAAPPSFTKYKHDTIFVFHKQGRWLVICFLLGAVQMFFLFGMLFYLAETLDNYTSLSGIVRGFLLALPLLSLTLMSVWTGKHIEHQVERIKMFLITGTLITGGLCTILPFVRGPATVIALLFAGGIGGGLVLPCLNTLITSAVGKAERGIVTSLYNSIRFFGIAAGPAVFGALLDRPLPLFWGTSAACLLLVLLTIRFIHKPGQLKSKHGHFRLFLRSLSNIPKDPG